MKKLFALILAAVCGAVIFTGCNSDNDSDINVKTDVKVDTDINVDTGNIHT